ncbi:MAG: cytochrome c oxidase assembly protein [Pseudaminobacter sp.]|nr:cytochrome c oxidase assembly protein [Pseudaminobacter sp.]
MPHIFGHLSTHMLVHILLMNAVAPLAALALTRVLSDESLAWRRFLFPAMILQLAVLWGWHAPPALDAIMRSDQLHLVMQASVFLCALWFWSAVFFIKDDGRWRAILALLLTSKLFCLLGVLLVFAPRALYPAPGSGQAHVLNQGVGALDDQQLAGLLMLVACPATYVIAGIVIAARWFGAIEAASDMSGKARHAV